jgi:hypothetical protein
MIGYSRREIITVRGQSYLSRPPLATRRGVHTRRAERGMGGQYFGRREK